MKKYNWKNYNWKKFRRILAVVLALAILAYNMPRITMQVKAEGEEEPVVEEIEKTDLDGHVSFAAGVNEFSFRGEDIKPELVVSDGESTLNPATAGGFTVNYPGDADGRCVNVGEYFVTVTATEDNATYQGSVTLTYYVKQARFNENGITCSLKTSSSQYNGQAISINDMILVRDGVEIPVGRPNFTAALVNENNEAIQGATMMMDPGEYRIRFYGKGNFDTHDKIYFTYTITTIDINNENVKIRINPESPMYSSIIEDPEILVTYEGNSDIQFIEGEDYQVSFVKPFIIGENVITVAPVEGGKLSGKAVNLIWTLRTDGTITGENVYVENNKNGAKWFLNGTTIYYDDTNSEDFRIYGKENYQIGTENEINCEAIYENNRWAIKPNRDLDNQNIEFWLSYFRSGHWNKITLKFIKDSQDPVLTVSQDLDKTYVDGNDVLWTNSLKPVKIKVTDDKSGVKRMVTYIEKGATGEGTPVALDANGEAALTDLVQGTTYTFTAWDNVGHEVTFDYTVAMVDDSDPTITILANGTEVTWNENHVVFFGMQDLAGSDTIHIEISASDPETGLTAESVPVEYDFVVTEPAHDHGETIHFVAHNNVGEGVDVYVLLAYDPTRPILSDFGFTYNADQSATVSIRVSEDHLETIKLMTVDGTLIGVPATVTDNGLSGNVYSWTVTVENGKYSKADYYVWAKDFSGNTASTLEPYQELVSGEEPGASEGGEGTEGNGGTEGTEGTEGNGGTEGTEGNGSTEVTEGNGDKASDEIEGNLISAYVRTITIELDKESPVIGVVEIDGATPTDAGWYNTDVNFIIHGNEGFNHSSDNTVVLKYRKTGDSEWQLVPEPPVTDGINAFRFVLDEHDLEFEGSYNFQMFDKAGNASEIKTVDFNKDAIKPYGDDIYVAYKLDPVTDDTSIMDQQQMFVSSGEGDTLYANESIQVQLFVRDNLSGVAGMACDYKIIETHKGEVTCSTPEKIEGQYRIGEYYYDVFTVNLKNETGGSISLNGQMIVKSLVDAAGNVTSGVAETLQEGTQILVFDNEPPTLAIITEEAQRYEQTVFSDNMSVEQPGVKYYKTIEAEDSDTPDTVDVTLAFEDAYIAACKDNLELTVYENGSPTNRLIKGYDITEQLSAGQYFLTIHLPFVVDTETEYYIELSLADCAGNQTVLTSGNDDLFWYCTTEGQGKNAKKTYKSGYFVLDDSKPTLYSYYLNVDDDAQKNGNTTIIPEDVENVEMLFNIVDPGKYWSEEWFKENVIIELRNYNTDAVIKEYHSEDIKKVDYYGTYKVEYSTKDIETAARYLAIKYSDKANNALVLNREHGKVDGEMDGGYFISYPFIIDHEVPTLNVGYPTVASGSQIESDRKYYNNTNNEDGTEEVTVTLKEATFKNNVDKSGNVVYPKIKICRRTSPLNSFVEVNDDSVSVEWGDYDGDNCLISASVKLSYVTDEKGGEYEYKLTVEYKDAAGNNIILDEEFKNNETADGFKKPCKDGLYDGGILVLDNKNPRLIKCDLDGTFHDRVSGSDSAVTSVLERAEDGKKVNLTIVVDERYYKGERTEVRLVREGETKQSKVLEFEGYQSDGTIRTITYHFDYAEFGTGVYHIEYDMTDKATNPLVANETVSDEINPDGFTDGHYVSKSFIMDDVDPVVKITYNKAYRQIKDGAADKFNEVPKTGYKAYYGASEEKIQMTVEITEHFASEIYEDGTLVGLKDFECLNGLGEIAEKFTWTVQEGANDEPSVYVGVLEIATEGDYQFNVAYEDVARNSFELDQDTMGNDAGTNDKDEYESIVMILDTTAPVIKGTYLNKDKTDVTANYVRDYAFGDNDGEHRYYYNEEVAKGAIYLHLNVIDKNIRYSELYSGHKNYKALEKWRAYTLAENGDEVAFANETVNNAIQALKDNKTISNDKIDIDLYLEKQANYSFPIGMEDLAGNLAVLDKTPETMHVTYDTEDPEFETTWAFNSPEDTGIFDKIHYTENGYIFSSKPLRIVTTAKDYTAGVYSIEYEVKYLAADGHFVTLTFEDEPVLLKENSEPTALTQYREVVIPIHASCFKGTIKTTVVDYATNDIDVSRDHIMEDSATFASQSGITINTTTQPSRITNGMTFYNTDVLFNVNIREDYSGIRKYSYKAGGQAVQSGDFSSGYTAEDSADLTAPDQFDGSQAGNDITTNITLPDTLVASVNNSNGVEVSATFTSNTGYVKSTSATYNIDITAPTITVTYDNNNPAHETYYKDPRVATVVITERNFDKNDVEFTITNQHGTMPRITDWVSAGSGDAMTHTCQVIFDQDGDYTFTLSFMDMAGNRAQYDRVDEFTIDRTVPTYTVTYDNNNSKNSFYFDATRTATIDILEHNFDPDLIRISVTKDGRAFNPSYTWRRNGDHAVAVIEYLDDADYTFTIDGVDLANNELALYNRDHFVIDTVKPEVEITNVDDRSANNGEVKPIVKYSDTNLDKNKVDILLSGAHNGATDLPSTITATDTGAELVFSDFERVPGMDDIYTLNVTVYDLAGNHSEASIMFSVNRFGSVYSVDDWLAQLLEDVYTNNITSDVSITETNVDTLLESSISLNVDGDLRPLNPGTDYIVHESGSDVSWKQYTYQILASNFAQEGHYIIMITSKDRARNSSDNASKDKQIEFVVDKTMPGVVVSGVEHNGRYRENSRNVTVDVRDSAPLTLVSVIVNGQKTDYDASTLLNNDGKINFVIDAANSMQTLSVIARDAAGNECRFPLDNKDYADNLEEIRFLITANILVQFFMNRPLFIGSLIGLIVIIAGIVFFIVAGRKKKKDDRRKMIDNM